jgi:Fic family protein
MKNNRFDQRLKNIPSDMWRKVVQIDELRGKWVIGVNLSHQTLGRLKRSVLITSSGASTRIEGSKLSDEDIEKLMRGISIQKFTDRDEQEARGYFELLENIFDSWETIKFSENAIKHFHKELLKYAEKDEIHRGEYKKGENKVEMIDGAGKSIGVLFDTTPAYLTPKEMQELVEWTQEKIENNEYHPLIVIANFIVEFLNIHPFSDGNGRISRVLTNFLLLKSGYQYMPYISHEKIIEDNKPDYYMALRRSQKSFKKEKEDIIPWLDFFLTIFLKQSKMAIDLLSEDNIEDSLSVKQLAIWQYFQTVTETTPKDICEKVKIARPTINQVLNKLLQLKRIERIGSGRSTRYRKL